jgi:hypothetical protein
VAKNVNRIRVHSRYSQRKNATRLCSIVRQGAASGPATNNPEARKNSGIRSEASASLPATTKAGARPDVSRKYTVWWNTTRTIDSPFAASTHASREPASVEEVASTARVTFPPFGFDRLRR